MRTKSLQYAKKHPCLPKQTFKLIEMHQPIVMEHRRDPKPLADNKPHTSKKNTKKIDAKPIIQTHTP